MFRIDKENIEFDRNVVSYNKNSYDIICFIEGEEDYTFSKYEME